MPKKKSAKFSLSSEIPAISLKDKNIKIRIIDYDENTFQEKEAETIQDCFPFRDTASVSWIDVDNVNNVGIIKEIDEYFGLHPLVLEDIRNLDQRPKIEDFGNYLYISLKMLNYNAEIKAEQISIILGKNFVITFQTGKEGDSFEPIRESIRKSKGKIRKMGGDYLVYRLIDSVINKYFSVLENLKDKVETLEEELVSNPNKDTLKILHDLKKEIILIRKSVWPLREVVNILERGDSTLIKKSTRVYLRSLYYNAAQIVDNVETTRETLSEMTDIYLSSISNKLNEIMKVLTIIATIFMPLTFVAGMYGMNFKYFPEISWRYGYLLFWIIVLSVAFFMLLYFKKRKWI